MQCCPATNAVKSRSTITSCHNSLLNGQELWLCMNRHAAGATVRGSKEFAVDMNRREQSEKTPRQYWECSTGNAVVDHRTCSSTGHHNLPSVTLEQGPQGLQSLGCRGGKAVLPSTSTHHNAIDWCTGLVGPADTPFFSVWLQFSKKPAIEMLMRTACVRHLRGMSTAQMQPES